jgi:hypothetical protein
VAWGGPPVGVVEVEDRGACGVLQQDVAVLCRRTQSQRHSAFELRRGCSSHAPRTLRPAAYLADHQAVWEVAGGVGSGRLEDSSLGGCAIPEVVASVVCSRDTGCLSNSLSS